MELNNITKDEITKILGWLVEDGQFIQNKNDWTLTIESPCYWEILDYQIQNDKIEVNCIEHTMIDSQKTAFKVLIEDFEEYMKI